ncbi:MAG: hypothetical protein IKM35_00700 [Bacteroidaceae bacterium]|nr:hypothetical protein [Bacteroidaceae bacterium]
MKMYFRKEFERDLVAAYNRVLKTCGRQAIFMTRQEIISKTITNGAPKFYITYEMARRNVSALLRGAKTDCNNRLKQLMYADIARLTIDYQRRHKRYADDFNGALMCVLSEIPAPRFYITEKSAYNTLCRLLRKKSPKLNTEKNLSDINLSETIKSNNNGNKQQ